jgi:hypothetical protein
MEGFEKQVWPSSRKKQGCFGQGLRLWQDDLEGNERGRNVLSTLASLKEPKETLDTAFGTFAAAEGSCEYILSFESSIQNIRKHGAPWEADYQELTKCKADTAWHIQTPGSFTCGTYLKCIPQVPAPPHPTTFVPA